MVHISTGNTKTGISSFNLLAGDKAHAYNGATPKNARAELLNVCGTCTGNCPGCYAKAMTRYINVYNAYAENTLQAMNDPFGTVAEIESKLYGGATLPRYFRIHDSGDFFSLEYFTAWVELAKRHPETIFYAYTKEAEIVTAYGVDNLPDNFTLLCSPWEGVADPIADLPQFIYDNGSNPEIAKLPHCPAVDKEGHRTGVTCIQCKACPNAKRGTKRAVYAH